MGISLFELLASVMTTESYVRKFTYITCEMKSMHIYSAFFFFLMQGPLASPRKIEWLPLTSTARYTMYRARSEIGCDLVGTSFDSLFVLLSRILTNSANIMQLTPIRALKYQSPNQILSSDDAHHHDSKCSPA